MLHKKIHLLLGSFIIAFFVNCTDGLIKRNNPYDPFSYLGAPNWTVLPQPASFLTKSGHKAVVYKDEIYLIGGSVQTMKSSDGTNWSQIATGHLSVDHCVVFKDKIWRFYRRNVWNTENGMDWHLVTDAAPVESYGGYNLTKFNGALWVIQNNDIWKSLDGTDWTMVTDSALVGNRSDAGFIGYKDRLWVIGGGRRNDVWSSEDEVNWVRQIQHAAFLERSGLQLTHDGRFLWLYGGKARINYYNDTDMNDLWRSEDGVNWTQIIRNTSSEWNSHGKKLVPFNDLLFLIGGTHDTMVRVLDPSEL